MKKNLKSGAEGPAGRVLARLHARDVELVHGTDDDSIRTDATYGTPDDQDDSIWITSPVSDQGS